MCWNPAHRGGQTAQGSWGDLQEDHPPGVRPRRGGELGRDPQPRIHQVGGLDGMKLFVQTPEFKAMNVGFGLGLIDGFLQARRGGGKRAHTHREHMLLSVSPGFQNSVFS